MKKALHIVAHVGLIALQVANAASKVIPPPWNVAVAGGAALAQGIIALRSKPTAQPPQSPVTELFY
jgi:hypothetical protein